MRVKTERKTDWSITLANQEGDERIKSFFKEHLWPEKTEPNALYQWKYAQNPAGKTLAIIGKNTEEKVIATSMFLPWKISTNGLTIGAYQWVDLFVAPDYRGQDIPGLTLQQGLKESRCAGIPVCFAFPNNNSIPIHKKNNGILLGYIKRYTKPLNVTYLLRRSVKWDFLLKAMSFPLNLILRLFSKETYCLNLSGFSFEKAENCGQEFDDLWQRCRKTLGKKITSNKDSAYLNWKHINSPNKNRQIYSLKKKSRLYGFAVLESTADIGYIVDILADSESALKRIIANSIKYFRQQGKNSAVFVALENNLYLNSFNRFGFIERAEKAHFYVYLDEALKDKEFFLDSRNWLITIGDCDIESL